MTAIVNLTDQSFSDEVLKSTTPVLVDFWAPWCGPCKALSPVIDELASMYDGKVKIAKMNVDENANTPAQYGVRSIPYLVFFKNGEVVNNVMGAQQKQKIQKMLDAIV
jgi:thioredoxin 1